MNNGPEIVGTWDYFFGTMYLVPRLAHGALIESIRYMHQEGLRAYFSQMNPIWGFDTWKSYAMLNLLWDTDMDMTQEWQKFLHHMYGPAAPHMADFYMRCEQIWMSQPPPAQWIKYYINAHQAVLFTGDDLAALRQYLQLARKAAADQRHSAAVAITEEAFTITEAFWTFMHNRWDLEALHVNNRTEFETLLTELQEHIALKVTLDELTKATIGGNELDLNAAMHRTHWVFNASPVPKLAYRAAHWIRQHGTPNDLKRLQQTVTRWPGFASLNTLTTTWSKTEEFFETLADGSFEHENSLQFWQQIMVPWEGASTAVVDYTARTGNRSYVVRQAGYHYLTTVLNVAPGHELTASLYVKGQVSPNPEVILELSWYDAHWRPIGRASRDRMPPGAGQDWHPLLVADVAPSEATQVRIKLIVRRMLPGDVIYADDFSLRVYLP